MPASASPPSDASAEGPDEGDATTGAAAAREPAEHGTAAIASARPDGAGSSAAAPSPDGPERSTTASGGTGADADETPDTIAEADLDDPDHIPDEVAPGARPATRRRVWAIQRRRAKHKRRSRAFRIAYGTLALVIFVLGLVSGPLPGPGPVILIPLGLAMLALEFVWAERALAYAMDKAEGAKEGAQKASWKQRLFVVAAVILFFAAVISAIYLIPIPVPVLNPNP